MRITASLPLFLALSLTVPALAWGLGGSPPEPENACAVAKSQAVATYHKCWAKNGQRTDSRYDWASICEKRVERKFRRADKKSGCGFSGGSAEFAELIRDLNEALQEAKTDDHPPTGITLQRACNLDEVNLLDFEVWRRELGYWVGEYTFLGADGNPNQSSSWPYTYQPYQGFISLQIEGNRLRQRNVFTYPPQHPDRCTGEEGDVKGNGTCGVHGNEKIFSADQTAADCEGNLAGPFVTPFGTANTFTTIIEPDTVIYRVEFGDPPFDGNLLQNQMTTLPNEQTRIRSAKGFNVATQSSSYLSYYRERKVSREEFEAALEQARIDYNILPEDECGWDGTTNLPTEVTCDEHFADD